MAMGIGSKVGDQLRLLVASCGLRTVFQHSRLLGGQVTLHFLKVVNATSPSDHRTADLNPEAPVAPEVPGLGNASPLHRPEIPRNARVVPGQGRRDVSREGSQNGRGFRP
eukprot:1844705-Alexandrium_andersonii.AAC.1